MNASDAEHKSSTREKWNDTHGEWKDAEPVCLPCLADLRRVLNERIGFTPKREIYLRRRVWWRGNDHLRTGFDGMPANALPALTSSEYSENLNPLLSLVDQMDEPRPIEQGRDSQRTWPV